LNKFEICSYLKFVQNLKKNKNKNSFNPKSEQISKYKIVQIFKKKIEKSKANREEAPHGPVQQEHHVGGPNWGVPARGD
jgi:hypothetical protein